MNFIRLYRSRKYLFNLLFSITILMVVFLSVSTTLLYYNSDKTMLQMQQQSDLKVLTQIKYNIDYMHDTVKNIAVSMYFDPDVVYLSNIDVMDKGELAKKLNRLEKTVTNSSFLQNVTIYNAKTGCYYSTLSSLNCKDDGMNGVIDTYMHKQNLIPMLTFVPLYYDKTQFPTLSMFIYDTMSGSKLIVTIKPSWLFDNLTNMNKSTDELRGSIFITDKSGVPITAQQQVNVPAMDATKSIIQEKMSAGVTQDYLVHGSGEDKSILSFMSSNKNDWVIASDQPYKVVWSKLSKMRVISFEIIIAFLILSIAGSLVIAYRLYRPIEHLLNQVTGIRRNGSDDKSRLDELNVISSAYHDAMFQLDKRESEEHSNRDALKTYALRRLISDASQPTPEEMDQVNWDIQIYKGLCVCVLLIDDFAIFDSKMSDGEKRMYKFAIANITKELVSKRFNCEVVPMGNDHFVLLVGEAAPQAYPVKSLTDTIKELQQTLFQFYRLSLTVSIGEKVDRYQEVSQQYGVVMENANYRMIFGEKSIITTDLVRQNNDNITYRVPVDAEKKITEAIKSGQVKDFQEHMSQLFEQLKVMHYNNIMYAILHLLALMENVVREMNSRTVRQVSLDFKRQAQHMMRQETLEPIYQVLLDIFEDIQKQRTQDVKEQSNQILIDTIKEMIEVQYKDLNLSMQSIATAMKLSSAHVSKQFRMNESVSISEYINDVRLGKALILLETKDYSITRIMEMVGYNNESYFFKLFKKKFGITPKEYRFKTVVQE
jgi:AraC-like DNA-binding protein